MANRKIKADLLADPQLRLALESLAELKSMDHEIWPSKKPPATDEAALTVLKGMHVAEPHRRKA